MKGAHLAIGVVILSILLVACSSSETISNAPANPTEMGDSNPADTTNTQETATQETDVLPEREQTPKQLSAAKELLNKHKNVKSIDYTFDGGSEKTIEVAVKGDKILKRVPSTQYTGDSTLGSYYNAIYLDRSSRTAYTHCRVSGTCEPEHQDKALQLDFAKQNVITPIDIISKVTSASIIAEQQFNRRETTIIEYMNNGGRREQLWVDSFFGVPLQQKIFGSTDDADIIEEHTFTSMAFNSLKDSDVTLSEKYTIE
jgi:uncharacterized protein YcfL